MHKVNLQGNEAKLCNRYFLLKKLICYGLEKIISLSKTSLKSMSADFTLTFGVDISKDDLIENISNAMINNHNDTVDQIVASIEEEEIVIESA